MVVTAKRKQTTSTVEDQPVSAKENVEMADAPENQTEESEDQSEVARKAWLEEAAYYKAEARDFEPGHEQEDWLVAEKEYQKVKQKK